MKKPVKAKALVVKGWVIVDKKKNSIDRGYIYRSRAAARFSAKGWDKRVAVRGRATFEVLK